MEINFNNFGSYDKQRAKDLLSYVMDLDIDIPNNSFIDINQNSGWVYWYSEDYNFSIATSLNGATFFCWNNFENGEEEFLNYHPNYTLKEIEKWILECEKKHGLHFEELADSIKGEVA